MSDRFQVLKSSGQSEAFDVEKLRDSLRRSGANEALINQVLQEMEGQYQNGMRTRSIYKQASKLLRRLNRPVASRYNLKQAIFDFGYTGFPFEDFFAEVLKSRGFQTQTRQLLAGACIHHEVDVVAGSSDTIIWVECKYHPRPGGVTDVKVPLYVHSRFRDLEQYQATTFSSAPDKRSTQGWIVTNSRFSDDAMRYGRCAGLHLIGWNYPSGASLREMVDRKGLYPLTCLTTLTRGEKERLLENNIVLSRALAEPGRWSDVINLSAGRRKLVMWEAQELCAVEKTMGGPVPA